MFLTLFEIKISLTEPPIQKIPVSKEKKDFLTDTSCPHASTNVWLITRVNFSMLWCDILQILSGFFFCCYLEK